MWLKMFLFLANLLSTSLAESDVVNPIHLLRQRSGTGDHRVEGLDCLSWRLAVETNNLRNWKVVPESCENYVSHYMLGKRYRHDCEVVADAAVEYAKSVKLAGDGKDVWVFDIDETALSNILTTLDLMSNLVPYNETKFNEWVAEGAVPPVPAIRRLYKLVSSLGFKTVFLTGTAERFRDVRMLNLNKAGYYNWEKLFLRGETDRGTSAVEYKSKKRTELVNEGYRIVGNIGDQWSDLVGTNLGNRTFKVPNPVYYVR